MGAPLATELKQQMAASLLDRVREKTAMARFWRYNACAKHGVPIDSIESEILTSSTPVEQQTPQQAFPQAIPATVTVQPKSLSGTAKGALATLAVLTGLGGAGTAGYMLSKDKVADPPAAVVEAPQPVGRVSESPYQYIEDIGEHLP